MLVFKVNSNIKKAYVTELDGKIKRIVVYYKSGCIRTYEHYYPKAVLSWLKNATLIRENDDFSTSGRITVKIYWNLSAQ